MGDDWKMLTEPKYDRGILDGFQIALEMHARRFDRCRNLSDVRRAVNAFRADAERVVARLQAHRFSHVAAFYGFEDVWKLRVEELRALVELPSQVDVDEDADQEDETFGGAVRP